ncbi:MULTISPECIES: LysR substrate-binding domain-containing protein [Vibrio]|uniref:LysR family transcriptional regulator n=2 Tax=Vibrio alginolyticus TaxID=663 RepID=A0AA36XPT2_VIBAL|nr:MULTISPECIES: LysR substrate-binding domain-containing protein [Vibrio]AGV18589.1 putative transcriptional regulator, LysR family [Vibrio alginolyticus NBRC 15630 = ATCC 17749]AVF71477.1 LysR family transcriptional regulator [Vibrio alginolyticus]EGQ8054062.1 LysR family transcriptional regulator [Vibrio alginolyticus]EGQ9136182.1 LysR family transcriptional regulator [Vibrio alginolyticus]EGQ9179239.1 LysR family transcriptional regulator [Vibrio alginolyticus]
MKSNLISGLCLFSQVAEYNSFTGAARHLHLTTGAISQQIIHLEALLGFTLFERHSRGTRLTVKGTQLHQATQFHFSELSKLLDELKVEKQTNEIRLKLTPSFAFKWLVPKLESFHHDNPDIQVQIFAEGALVNSEIKDYDVAIDYGLHPYRNANAELILDEHLLPVMSPKYLEDHGWLKTLLGEQKTSMPVKQWQEATLLHDAMPWEKATRDYEWLYWASAMGLDFKTDIGHFFNRTDMAMSAAEAGVGIAMARMALIEDELTTERLVSPFKPIPANAGYYLIMNTRTNATETFRHWLLGQLN